MDNGGNHPQEAALMRWRERSVPGPALALGAALVACVLACALAVFRMVLLPILLLPAFPVTLLYSSIACPRCGNHVLRPWPWDPARCQECRLPTNQPWKEESRT